MRVKSAEINREMRKLCKKHFRGKSIDPNALTEKFKEKHPDLVEEFKEHAFDIWFRDKARHLLKNSSYNLRKATQSKKRIKQTNPIQDVLPLKIKIEGKTLSIWVKRKDASLKELVLYEETLKGNVDACAVKMREWRAYVRAIKPLLLNNPKWKVGDAEKYLLEQGEFIKLVA
jgi:hypothetical protein